MAVDRRLQRSCNSDARGVNILSARAALDGKTPQGSGAS
jgi:hypothetical protein